MVREQQLHAHDKRTVEVSSRVGGDARWPVRGSLLLEVDCAHVYEDLPVLSCPYDCPSLVVLDRPALRWQTEQRLRWSPSGPARVAVLEH